MSLGKPEKAIGHIYLRWLPAESLARLSLWSAEENTYCMEEFNSPTEAGAEAVRLTQKVADAYARHQQATIDQHLQDFRQFDPSQRIQAARGFRPITIRAAHADFVDRTLKEAAAFRQCVYEGAANLRLRGWVEAVQLNITEFTVPNPWK